MSKCNECMVKCNGSNNPVLGCDKYRVTPPLKDKIANHIFCDGRKLYKLSYVFEKLEMKLSNYV
jgi:hypothetical protein